MGQGGEEGKKIRVLLNQLVSLRLNGSIFQVLNLPPPPPRTLEMPYLRGPVIHLFTILPVKEALRGSLWSCISPNSPSGL